MAVSEPSSYEGDEWPGGCRANRKGIKDKRTPTSKEKSIVWLVSNTPNGQTDDSREEGDAPLKPNKQTKGGGR